MMAIRKQVYQWDMTPANSFGNQADGSWTQSIDTGGGTPSNLGRLFPTPGEQFSIFTGGYGPNVTESNMVRETDFVVIDRFGSTPGIIPRGGVGEVYDVSGNQYTLLKWRPNGFVQIVIDTTGYYQDPQNVFSQGISGNAAPFPETSSIRPTHYKLAPPVYVHPFQTWDVRYTMFNDLESYLNNFSSLVDPARGGTGSIDMILPADLTIGRVFVQYWLFTGSDALIAEELSKLGIPATVDNAEWFRRQLILNQGLETDVWQRYLKLSKKWVDMEKERDDYLDVPKED